MTPEQLDYHMRQSHPDILGTFNRAAQHDAQSGGVKTLTQKGIEILKKEHAMSPALDPKTQTVDLAKIGDTTNFVKFGHPFERGGQGDQIAGILYVPKKLAKDVEYLRVTLMKS